MIDRTTLIVLIVIIALVVIYIFRADLGIKNKGELKTNNTPDDKKATKSKMDKSDDMSMSDSDMSSYDASTMMTMTTTYDDSASCSTQPYNDMDNLDVSDRHMAMDDIVDSSIETIAERAMGRNALYKRKKLGGKYAPNSYRGLNSGSLKNIEANFKVPDVTRNETDKFVPNELSTETAPMMGEDTVGAPINIGSRRDAERDKYNINSFLPQEEEKDWFETIETVNVKNSHLINIYRPIGVNTIGNTQKNPSYDIRGTGKAIAPKYVVSPWLQSTIEPDRSTKPLC